MVLYFLDSVLLYPELNHTTYLKWQINAVIISIQNYTHKNNKFIMYAVFL